MNCLHHPVPTSVLIKSGWSRQSKIILVQVCSSKNRTLAQELHAHMQEPDNRPFARCKRMELLPLCRPETVMDEVREDADVLVSLSGRAWRRMAHMQPQVCMQLMESALGRASNEVQLGKRWDLVRTLLHKRRYSRPSRQCACFSWIALLSALCV